ncbi:MAG TPA: hypothetical protein VF773_12015 [Verrucomicrobiae bacterium]
MILADASQNFTASFLLSLLSAAGFLAWLVSSLKNAFGKPKREVSFSEQYATKQELQRIEGYVTKLEHKVETAVKEIRSEMKADRDEMLKAGEARASKLHGRIDDVLEAVAELRGWREKNS